MILKSIFPDIAIPEIPLGKFLVDCLEMHGEKVAMVDVHSGNEITFKQLRVETLRIIKLLLKAGIRKGDIVGLVLPFITQYVPLYIAIIYCGGVLFGTKLLYKSSIHNQLAGTKPILVITTNERLDDISDNMKNSVPSVKLCLSVDQLQNIKPGSLRNIENDLPSYEAINVYKDPAIIYQSSGTTGKPKGIIVTHYGMISTTHAMKSAVDFKLGDCFFLMCSIIHAEGLEYIFVCIYHGVKFVHAHSLTEEQHFDVIKQYKINFMAITNINVLRGMFELYDAHQNGYDLSSLKSMLLEGTSFPPDLIQDARNKFGIDVAMTYGLTEAGWVSIGCSNSVPCNSAGRLVNNVELRVVDEHTGKELECGDKGEICVRGPQIMKEYLLHDGTKLDVLKNGWFNCGDLGYYDKYGYIYIIGRTKDTIMIQPENIVVMPVEFEQILLRHKQISDVAIAGVPHPDYGEAPCAFVVRKDIKLTEEEVIRFFQSKTEKITNLHGGVKFVDVIPRTELGKPLRRKLIENMIQV